MVVSSTFSLAGVQRPTLQGTITPGQQTGCLIAMIMLLFLLNALAHQTSQKTFDFAVDSKGHAVRMLHTADKEVFIDMENGLSREGKKAIRGWAQAIARPGSLDRLDGDENEGPSNLQKFGE